MRCKYCGYDVDVTKMTMIGVCGVCAPIAQGLGFRTITSEAVARILKDTRPEEGWVATWGKAA
jgi:hypothetical protein